MNVKPSYQELAQEVETLRNKLIEAKKDTLFESYFENNHAAMLLIDSVSKKIVRANDAALQFYGFTKEDFLKKSIYDIHTWTPDEVDSKMQEALKHKSNAFEFKHRLTNGTEKEVKVFASPITVGHHKQMVVTVIDNSASKKLEEVFFKYEHLLQSVGESFLQIDNRGIITYANAVATKMFGCESYEELIGSEMVTLYAQAPTRQKLLEDLKKTGILREYEILLQRKTGEKFWASANVSYIIDQHGQKTGTQGLFHDITTIKETRENLLFSESKLSSLIDNRNDSIWSIDKNYRFLVFNKFFQQAFYDAFQVTLKPGINLLDILPANTRSFWKEKYDQALKGERVTFEITNTINQEPHWHEITFNPIFFNGEITGVSALSIDFTERKKAEDAVKRSEEQFKLLNQMASEMLSMNRLQDIYELINSVLHKLLPNTITLFVSIVESTKQARLEVISTIEEGILGKIISFTGFDPRGKDFKLTDLHYSYFKTGHFLEFKGGLADFAGDQYPLLAIKAAEKLLGIHKIYTIGINRDKDLFAAIHFITFNKQEITDSSFIEALVKQAGLVLQKKITEEALRQSEQQFKEFFDKAADAIFVADLNTGHIVDANYTASKLLQKPIDEIIGLHQTELHPADNTSYARDTFERHKNEITRNNLTLLVENVVIRSDGSLVPVEILASAISIKGKHFIMGTFRDISLRKKTEEALKESELNFRSLFEKGPIGIAYHKMIYDETGKPIDYLFLEANASYQELTGVNPLGKRVTEAFPGIENDPVDWIGIYGDVAKNGKEIRFQQYLQLNDRWYDCAAYQYKPDHFVTAFLEITEQKKAEEALVAAKEKAEESDRLKSAFLANMSHEIRTPMNGILGFAELLKEPYLTGEQQLQYIDIIGKAGERMLNIINDIVDISKIESGQMEVYLQKSNINDQIDYLFTFFKPLIEEKGIQFSLKKTLANSEALIETDKEKVYAILTNLIKNASKHTSEGKIEMGYKLINSSLENKSTSQKMLEFYVKDTGSGIPKNRQAAIFKRFVQADVADKLALQGAGLGLSISKAYIEMMGGKIWVESEPGQGSTFYFTLPYKPFAEEKPTESEQPQPLKFGPSKQLKVLLAEDDTTSSRLLTVYLAELASEIIHVKNGLDAVETCRNNPDIDLILMDIQLPSMHGYEATQKIREFNKTVIILAQTAFALEGDREKALQAGCNGYFAKPILKKDFLDTVKTFWR